MLHFRELLFSFSALALASCTSEAPIDQSSDLWTIEAGIEVEESSTRTTFVEDVPLRIMKGVYWTPGDCIGVFSKGGSENSRFESDAVEPSALTKFTGNFEKSPAYAYYPYAEVNSNSEAIVGSLPLEQNYSTVDAKLTTDYKFGKPLPVAVNKHYERYKFEHVFPMLRFVVENVQGTALAEEHLNSITISFPNGVELNHGDFTFSAIDGTVIWKSAQKTQSIKLNWTDKPSLSNNTIYGYYFCDDVAGLYNKELVVKITTDKHSVTFPARIRMSQFKPNYIYTFPLNLKRWQDKLGDSFVVDTLPGQETEDGLIIDGGSADSNVEVLDVLS